jgi:tetratricopeptide (TPR) repeat protein
MSRARLPRRIPISIALAAAVTLGGAAWAQSGRAGSRLSIGAPNAEACSLSIVRNDLSDAAINACDRAIESESLPRVLQLATLINRGALRLRRREGEAALADFDTAISIDARNAEAHLNRGAALVMLQRPGLAVAAITEALGLGVREPHKAYLNRGAAREALGDLRGAYEDYSTALEIQPDWGPANAELARFARTRREHLAEVLNEQTGN